MYSRCGGSGERALTTRETADTTTAVTTIAGLGVGDETVSGSEQFRPEIIDLEKCQI